MPVWRGKAPGAGYAPFAAGPDYPLQRRPLAVHVTQQRQLVASAVEVVIGVGGAEVAVAFEVVRQKSHGKHERDVQDPVDQGVLFGRCQGGGRAIAAGDGLDPREVETDTRRIGLVLVCARRRRADEVAEVEGRGARHDGVQIDHAERARVVGVEQHVADLAIVVRDAVARELDGREAGKALDRGAGVLCMPRAAADIGAQSAVKRTETGAQIVETRHGILEVVGRQGAGFVQERAKRTARLAGYFGRRRNVHVAARGYEAVQAPERAVGIPMQQSAIRRSQDFGEPVRLRRIHALQVAGDAFGMREDGLVDALQQVVAAVAGGQAVAVVDVACAVPSDPRRRADTEGAGGLPGCTARLGFARGGFDLADTRSAVGGLGQPAIALSSHAGRSASDACRCRSG